MLLYGMLLHLAPSPVTRLSACVVSIPCGKPGYVFRVPFCTSLTARGPEVSWGTTWWPSPFMARTGTLIFFRSSL